MSIARSSLVVVGAALAAGLPAAPRTAAQDREMNPAMRRQLDELQPRVVDGRIVVTGRMRGRTAQSSNQSGNREESLSIDQTGDRPRITYELKTERLRFYYASGGPELEISQTAEDGSHVAEFSYQQPAEGAVRLVVGAPPDEKVVASRDLWRLVLQEPELCGEHLMPALQFVHRRLDLSAAAAAVEAALVQFARAREGDDRAAWARLVSDLGHPKFSRREAAERKLRGLGAAVLAYLLAIDRSSLDAEQRLRVRRITREIAGRGTEDTPPLAAVRLAADPGVWLALMHRDDTRTRAAAAGRLAWLLGEPVEFDPQAAEATRAAQLEQIRRRLAEREKEPQQAPNPDAAQREP